MSVAPSGIKDIQKQLGDLAELVDIQRGEDRFIITLRKYIYDKEKWNKIHNVVKQAGGEWVSEGKNSHWMIPFSVSGRGLLDEAEAHLAALGEIIRKLAEA